MSREATLVKNTAILALGKLSSQVIGFLLLPLYTYYLSPAEYGFVDLALVYVSLLVPALTLQLEMASFRYLVDARADRQLRVHIVSNIVYMLVPLILPWIAVFVAVGLFFGLPYFSSILLAGVAMLWSNLSLQITRGIGNNKEYSIASIILGVSTALIAVLTMAIMDMGISGMFMSIIVANGIAGIYLLLRLKLYQYVRLGESDKNLQREMLGYSVPLVPNGVAWWVINASDRTIITAMIGVGANGIYAVATKYSSILYSMFGVFGLSWTESASLHIDAKDRDRFFSNIHNSAIRLFGGLGLSLIAVIPFVFPVLVDASFKEAYLYIPILVIGALCNAVVGLYSAVYIAKRLTRQVMNTSIAAAALNIVLTVSLVPVFGLYAAAGATALAFLAMAIFRHFDVKKYVKITYKKSIFAALGLLYAAVMSLYYMDTLWASVIGLVIAVVAAYWLNRREVSKIKGMVLGKVRG